MSTSTSARQPMSTSEMFSDFLGNLVIDDRSTISDRYEKITSALNRKFRDTASKTANSIQIGSYGRRTGIKGLSDLDMIYILPKGEWKRLEKDPSKALSETKQAIEGTYHSSDVSVDRLVVVVRFKTYVIEVQPCFEQEDGSFLYPDTYRDQWLPTKPREEMTALDDMDKATNGNLRDLCKMARAWRNKHGLKMSGLLVDTLAYQFIGSTNDYDATSYSSHDKMVFDFFTYLSEETSDRSHYKAPGSGQNVRIKKRFQKKAKKAVELCQSAIDASGQASCHDKWRKTFGRSFPLATTVSKSATQIFAESRSWRDTEEFIEDLYPIDVRYDLKIDCTVSQKAHRSFSLREFLAKKLRLAPYKTLEFFVERVDPDLAQPYEIRWKVLNRGDRANELDCIRGQIKLGSKTITECTSFRGEHIVECFIVKDGVVVAKDRIDVPIQDT